MAIGCLRLLRLSGSGLTGVSGRGALIGARGGDHGGTPQPSDAEQWLRKVILSQATTPPRGVTGALAMPLIPSAIFEQKLMPSIRPPKRTLDHLTEVRSYRCANRGQDRRTGCVPRYC